jgi:TPR repeat protein
MFATEKQRIMIDVKLFILIFLFSSLSIQAQTENKDCEKETKQWIERILRGFAEEGADGAQYLQGNRYYSGDGVEQSYTEAVKWYRLSAEQGYAPAQYNLGICYKKGYGVPKSISESVKWIKKSKLQKPSR